MGVVSRIAGALGLKSSPQPRPFEEVMARLDGGLGGSALVPVTSSQAMQVATVMACVRVIANGCATPRLHVYRERRDGTRELATNIPEYRLLNRRPNEWQTSFEFRRLSGVDAQHVETRRLQVEEICRAYGVFPIMVGHSDKSATFASSEAFLCGARQAHPCPVASGLDAALDEMLLDGSGPLFAEFDTRYMMAGSMKDRAQWARTMAEMGIYTRNEIRDEEGKDPLPGSDKPLTPMNMGGSAPDETKEIAMTLKTIRAPETREGPGGRETRAYALQIKATGDDGTSRVTVPCSGIRTAMTT
jgi:phage portal protein BeeE